MMEVAAEHTTWLVEHENDADHSWWYTTWTGKRHRSDDVAQASTHLRLAHQALDRSYSVGDSRTRLVRKVERHTVSIEVVPAMWCSDEERCYSWATSPSQLCDRHQAEFKSWREAEQSPATAPGSAS